ncbi:hypothetical protein [Halorussus ruber]|uniref:hypothetical protein n=1 Tax=Halorussus ruber TaxID=1126238 RepID=UPI0010919815|nr:hypothetical protein [Halorussus ruber]
METFRTKRGRCVLTDEEIRIEEGLVSHARRYWEGNRLLLVVYLGVYAALLAASASILADGDSWDALAVAVGAVAVVLVVGRVLNRRRDVTGDDRIALLDVERVEAVEGDDWLTRPRLVVHYWRGGGVKHRHVMMPSGLLSYGGSEFERAKDLLRERGISVETIRPDESSV